MDLTTIALLSLLILMLALTLIALVGYTPMLLPFFFRGAPYVPTSMERVATMVRIACIRPEDTVIDLGSGDGRLVIAAAQAGAKRSVGYEINPTLVRYARFLAKRRKLDDRTAFVCKSLWSANLRDTTVVLLYQLPFVMNGLEKKLREELPPGARIVSNGFRFEHWPIAHSDGPIHVYRT